MTYAPRSVDRAIAELSRRVGNLEREKNPVVASGIAVIADSTLAVAAASFDFTSIPSTYAHLMIYAYLRGTLSATLVGARIRFNNDSSAIYDTEYQAGTGTTGSTTQAIGQTAGLLPDTSAATAPGTAFSGQTVQIPHYANATNYKYYQSQGGAKAADTTGSHEVFNMAAWWRAAAAINRITIFPASGNWDVGSRVTLYGLTAT